MRKFLYQNSSRKAENTGRFVEKKKIREKQKGKYFVLKNARWELHVTNILLKMKTKLEWEEFCLTDKAVRGIEDTCKGITKEQTRADRRDENSKIEGRASQERVKCFWVGHRLNRGFSSRSLIYVYQIFLEKVDENVDYSAVS